LYLCFIKQRSNEAALKIKKVSNMKNFFESDQYTEFCVGNEIWAFGNTPENITEETPHRFVGRDNTWGDGTEEEMELPITDGHGTREYVSGRVYVGAKHELCGTTAEEKISRFNTFNIG